MTINNEDDNRIGYGKPPKRTRFKPGQSGNPRGRPRSVDLKQWESPMHKYMLDPVTVTVGGKKQKMPGVDALMKGAIMRALGGCTKHLKILIDGSGGLRALFQEQQRQTSQVDREFLRQLRERAEKYTDDRSGADGQRRGRGRDDERPDRRRE
jgi:hypothetical protein